MVTRRRDKDSACFQMQEDQDEQIAKASLRHDLLGVEVTLPHGFGMPLNKLIPRARSTFGADVVAVSLEDIFHGIASYRLDSELLQLAENPCVAPRVVLRQLEDQLFDLLGRSWPADILSCLGNLVRGISNPPSDRRGVNDRRQFVQGRS